MTLRRESCFFSRRTLFCSKKLSKPSNLEPSKENKWDLEAEHKMDLEKHDREGKKMTGFVGVMVQARCSFRRIRFDKTCLLEVFRTLTYLMRWKEGSRGSHLGCLCNHI